MSYGVEGLLDMDFLGRNGLVSNTTYKWHQFSTTTLWDKIGAGYVSDAYVSTGSDGRVAPDCT
jgi:hypothetical protein